RRPTHLKNYICGINSRCVMFQVKGRWTSRSRRRCHTCHCWLSNGGAYARHLYSVKHTNLSKTKGFGGERGSSESEHSGGEEEVDLTQDASTAEPVTSSAASVISSAESRRGGMSVV